MRWIVFLSLGALAGCWADETLTGYGAKGRVWTLQSIDGTPFGARAEIEFPDEGRIAGRGPCNSFTAAQSHPYPWFATGPIVATRMVCPDLEREAAFFTALSAMTLAEVVGDTLILSTDTGREMVFRAAE